MTTLIDLSKIGPQVVPIDTWNPQNGSPDDEFDYIDIASVDRDSKTITGSNRIRAEDAPSRARQIVHVGDVIVSTVRPNLNAVASVPAHLSNAVASTGFCVLRCNPKKLYHRYLFHWVRTNEFVADMVRQATGASYPAVSDRIIRDSKIPLPPLSEQERIADILDKADSIWRKRREAATLLSKATSSLFFQEFGDPLFNPKDWDVVLLGDVCDKITDGVHFKPKYKVTGVSFISVKDITTGKLRFDDAKYVSEEDHKLHIKACHPEFGDVLLTKVGATYGRPALVDTGRPFSLYVSVALLKPNRKLIDPVFLKEVLASEELKRQADRSIKGAGVPDLHLVEIRKFRIPLPPLHVQQAFVEKTNAIHALEDKLKTASNEKGDLFNALVQRAFRGDL